MLPVAEALTKQRPRLGAFGRPHDHPAPSKYLAREFCQPSPCYFPCPELSGRDCISGDGWTVFGCVIPAILLSSEFSARQVFQVDGKGYEVLVDGRMERPLALKWNGKILDRMLKREWKPWSLEVADVDGDGRADLAVGIVKATRHLPFPHTCLWIIGVRDGHFTRKWLGSSMGRPLVEFCFGPPRAGGAFLFTLERTLDGRRSLSRYRWSGFGFKKAGGEQMWREAHGLRSQNGKIVVIVEGRGHSFRPEDWK